VGIAQPKALRNFGGIDELSLPQRAHPRPCACERQNKRLIDPTRLRRGIARNDYLLALASPRRSIRENCYQRIGWSAAT
jgi:hypothetical protein